MCDSDNQQGFIADTSFTRRATLLTMTAAAVAAGIPATALAASVTEKDVMVPTPDGKADAALFYPAGAGPWPAVLMWPDILGLRPVFRETCTIRRPSLTLWLTGFSTYTSLPACMAQIAASACQ